MNVDDFIADLEFRLPGWEQARFSVRDPASDSPWRNLSFTWTMPDSRDKARTRTVTVHTECPVQNDWSREELERAAWFCVRTAVLHEAGEHFFSKDAQPWHPHHHKWWEIEYKAGLTGMAELG